MTDLVERVAKALYEARFCTTWAKFLEKDRFDSELMSADDWRGFARVAVEMTSAAMREQDMRAITECTDAEFEEKLAHLRRVRRYRRDQSGGTSPRDKGG